MECLVRIFFISIFIVFLGKPDLKQSGEAKEEDEALKLEEASDGGEGGSSSPGIKRPFDQMAATSSSATPTTTTEKQADDDEMLTVKCVDIATADGEVPSESSSLVSFAGGSACDKPSTSTASEDDAVEAVKNSPISFKVVFAKETYEITMDETDTVRDLKDHISDLTGISHDMQKLCFRGNSCNLLFDHEVCFNSNFSCQVQCKIRRR